MSVQSKGSGAMGRGDTFVIEIRNRQHSTWQGTIKQAETGTETHFRSALELLKIIDAALDTPGGTG